MSDRQRCGACDSRRAQPSSASLLAASGDRAASEPPARHRDRASSQGAASSAWRREHGRSKPAPPRGGVPTQPSRRAFPRPSRLLIFLDALVSEVLLARVLTVHDESVSHQFVQLGYRHFARLGSTHCSSGVERPRTLRMGRSRAAVSTRRCASRFR